MVGSFLVAFDKVPVSMKRRWLDMIRYYFSAIVNTCKCFLLINNIYLFLTNKKSLKTQYMMRTQYSNQWSVELNPRDSVIFSTLPIHIDFAAWSLFAFINLTRDRLGSSVGIWIHDSENPGFLKAITLVKINESYMINILTAISTNRCYTVF